jgi:serine/threonine-protein kinase
MRAFSLEDYGARTPLYVGGMSQSFDARRSTDGARVRIRQLLARFSTDHSTPARWLERIERHAALDHPGAVRIFDWGVSEGEAYAAVEAVDGLDLRRLLAYVRQADGKLSPSASVYLLRGLLAVVADAQEQGLAAHLDLDPRSVLLRPDASLTLTEFAMWEALPAAEAARRRFDRGRVHYLAPELARSLPGDARSDVFSAGAILFELLTGERPFVARTHLLVAMAIAEGKRSPIHELGLSLPDGLTEIVETMLARLPEERFQSARAALHALALIPCVDEEAGRA